LGAAIVNSFQGKNSELRPSKSPDKRNLVEILKGKGLASAPLVVLTRRWNLSEEKVLPKPFEVAALSGFFFALD